MKSCQLKCTNTQDKTHKKRALKTHSTLLHSFFSIQNSMCEIHEAKHFIYRKECLGEQDRGVGVSFVRNFLEGRSKKP